MAPLRDPEDVARTAGFAEKSMSPPSDASSILSPLQSTSASSGRREKLSSVSSENLQEPVAYSHLPQDQRFYLDYHRNYLDYHHYFFKYDADYFLHNTVIDYALLYEPLLFAVIGFAAFHLAMKEQHGKIETFLGFYQRSVSLLRKSLAAEEKHTKATMLTILQLAAFEVFSPSPLSC